MPENKNIKSRIYYLIGIGGCGMSSLAHILLDCNFFVAGSDIQKSVYTEELENRGVKIFYSHSFANIASVNPDTVIFSSAIMDDNPELVWAKLNDIPVYRRGEFLAFLTNSLNLICVVGMHGKTTTSAMLAYTLEKLNASLGYSIGWRVPQFKRHGKLYHDSVLPAGPGSKEHYFVIETDESDGTFTKFKPLYSIVLNIDREHMDYFRKFTNLKNEFGKFIANTRQVVIYCADNKELGDLMLERDYGVSYGLSSNATYRAINYKYDKTEGWTFDVEKRGNYLGRFNLQLYGIHNVLNATAVIALLDTLGFDCAEVAPAIASFKGVYRRQEELFNNGVIRIFDDYGHHPEEIIATINAIKPLINNRLLVVFQPHRYTRTVDLLVNFGTCFMGATKIWVMEIYSAGEKPISGITGELVVNELKKNGFDAEFEPSEHTVVEKVMRELRPGDVVLFCGAGANVSKSAHKLATYLKSNNYASICNNGKI